MREPQQLNLERVFGVQPRQQRRYYSVYCTSVALQAGLMGGVRYWNYMKQALIYPSTTGERFVYRGGDNKTKCLIAQMDGSIGRMADKPRVLTLYEITK